MGAKSEGGEVRVSCSVPTVPTWLALGIAVAAAVVFLAFHRTIFFESWGDENIHCYVAAQVAQGQRLYRDIHSARPPLAILPLVLLIKAHLSPLFAARTLVVLPALASAAMLFVVGRKYWGNLEASLAATFFLLAPELALRGTFTAIQLVSMWTFVAASLAFLDRPRLAGVTAAIALATGQHAVVLIAVIGGYIAWQRRRALIDFVVCFAAVVTTIAVAAFAIGGRGVFDDLLGKHLYHVQGKAVPEDSQLGWWITTLLLEHAPLVVLGCLTFFRAARATRTHPSNEPEERRRRIALACATLAVAHIATVLLIEGGQVLYLHLVIPYLALLGAIGTGHVLLMPSAQKWATTAGVLVALCIGFSAAKGRYETRDSQTYPALPHFRAIDMASMKQLRVVDRIATDWAAELAPGETIFGEANLATTLATRTGTKVSGQLADLAPRWIQLGAVTRESVFDALETDRVKIFLTPRWFYANDPAFRKYLTQCFEKPRIYPRETGAGRGLPDVLVFRHTSTRPCR